MADGMTTHIHTDGRNDLFISRRIIANTTNRLEEERDLSAGVMKTDFRANNSVFSSKNGEELGPFVAAEGIGEIANRTGEIGDFENDAPRSYFDVGFLESEENVWHGRDTMSRLEIFKESDYPAEVFAGGDLGENDEEKRGLLSDLEAPSFGISSLNQVSNHRIMENTDRRGNNVINGAINVDNKKSTSSCPATCCSDNEEGGDVVTNSWVANESSKWHCHSKETVQTDKVARNQLIAVCTLCILFMIGEIIGGVLSNSLALFTDVVHLGSDLISFFISLLAIYLSTKPPSKRMSFGYHRAEVLGALISVFIIWFVTGVLCYMAIERIIREHYKDVKADEMLVTAAIGVVFNIVMGIILHTEKCCGKASSQTKFGHSHGHGHGHSHGHSHGNSRHSHNNRNEFAYEPLSDSPCEHEMQNPASEEEEPREEYRRHKNINVRAAFIHVIGDIIQSVGVLIASLIIKVTKEEKYKLADPICTFLFSILVIFTTITVLRDTLLVIMEGVPRGINYHGVLQELHAVAGVKRVHSLMIWALTIDRNALAVHLVVEPGENHQEVLERASSSLRANHHLYQVTIQVESDVSGMCDTCQHCIVPKV